MTKTAEINLDAVVKKITGLELELHQSLYVSKDTKLYRFGEDDEVHLLTDGAGGFELIENPYSESDKKTHKGHLGDHQNL